MKLISITGIGLCIGAALGGAVLVASNPGAGGAPGAVMGDFYADGSQDAAEAAQLNNELSAGQPSVEPRPDLYQGLVAAFVHSGRGITRSDMLALAQIAHAMQGREDQYLASITTVAEARGGITLGEMMRIAGVEPDPLPGTTPRRRVSANFAPVGLPSPSNGSGIWDERSASRRVMRQHGLGDTGGYRGSSGAINARTGEYLNPDGEGYTSGGTYFAPSGPDGVVNPRTGEYSPIISAN